MSCLLSPSRLPEDRPANQRRSSLIERPACVQQDVVLVLCIIITGRSLSCLRRNACTFFGEINGLHHTLYSVYDVQLDRPQVDLIHSIRRKRLTRHLCSCLFLEVVVPHPQMDGCNHTGTQHTHAIKSISLQSCLLHVAGILY